MNNKVFISCAVTGSGDTASKHPDLPKTPEQIAKAAIESLLKLVLLSLIFMLEKMMELQVED